MHAASVNPEPGSNSLKNRISNPKISLRTSYLFQSFALSISYFFEFFFQRIFPSSFTLFSVFESLVVQFSMSSTFPRRESALLLYLNSLRLSSLFFKKMFFFRNPLCPTFSYLLLYKGRKKTLTENAHGSAKYRFIKDLSYLFIICVDFPRGL